MSMKINAGKKRQKGKSRTKQEFVKQADINEIMKRVNHTGMVDHVANGRPIFGDVSLVPDLHTTMNRIRAAEQAFLRLPCEIRARFANKMINLVHFLLDPSKKDEAVELGLLSRPKGEKVEKPKVAEAPKEDTKVAEDKAEG